MADWLQQNQDLWKLLSFILCPIYLIVGSVELLVSLGGVSVSLFNPDLMDSFLILVIGAVFCEGLLQTRHKEPEAFAFIIVGLILATVVFLLRVIVISSNLLGWALHLEDWASWSITEGLTWSLVIYLVTVPIVGVVWLSRKLANEPGAK
ncbi:MAG: hypothetical protein ACTSYL_03520 [Candidatus Thorarchaeota archaeon]